MKKNVFDTLPLVAVGLAVLLVLLRGVGLTGILTALLVGVFFFALIWSMRTTFDTETGEISCGKILWRDRFYASDIESAVIRRYPKGNVLELTANAKHYRIWQRCYHMHEFELFLQDKGVQIQSA